MEYSMEDRARKIIDFCIKEDACDPVVIFEHASQQDFVRMHGPEHHVLDGACLLTAFHHAGGNLHSRGRRFVMQDGEHPGF